jgi:hypothetical protein
VHYGVEEITVNIRKMLKKFYWTYLLIWHEANLPPNPSIINLPIFCVSFFVIFGTRCTFASVPVFLINCTFHVSRIHRMANGVIKGGIEAVSTYVTHQFGNLSGPMTCCSCRVSLQAKTLCIIGALLQVACTSTT